MSDYIVKGSADRPLILCIDDEPSVLQLLDTILREEFRVVLCGDAGAALRYVRDTDEAGRVGLIICDQVLPDIAGTDLLVRLRQSLPMARRLLLTGYRDSGVLSDSINRGGIWRYMEKPIDHDLLIQHARDGIAGWQQEISHAREHSGLKQRNEGLQEAVLEKSAESGMLLRILCHDLANNLAVLGGTTGILGNLNKDPALESHIARLARATGQMNNLLNEVKNYQSQADGRLTRGMAPYALHQAEAGLREIFAPRLEEKNLHLDFAVPPEHQVYCDPLLLRASILRNLLSNAVRYAPEGSTIRISSEARDEYTAIRVSDTGPGIPPEKLSGLFRKDPASGTRAGYGLAIVHAAVQFCGGKVEVDSRTGTASGTTMTIILPAHREAFLHRVA